MRLRRKYEHRGSDAMTLGRVFFVSMAAVSVGCSGADSPESLINPEAGIVRLQASGTAACGVVYWSIGGENNYPDGTDVTFPWLLEREAASFDVVSLEARNCCGGTCDNPPCSLTLTASAFWEGTQIATATTTDFLYPSCTPAVLLSVSVP
jgi:hypothetical protein